MTTKATRNRRNFSMPAATMLDRAATFLNLLATDSADLAAVDAEIDSAFETNMDGDITAALEAQTPEDARDELKLKTSVVNSALLDARNAMQELFLHVRKLDNPDIMLDVFGKKAYGKSSGSVDRMIILLEKAKANIADNQAQLISAGFTLDKITAFGVTLDSLLSAKEQQELAKALNKRNTEDYIDKLNKVWGRMVLMRNAAMIAFKDDFAKAQNYLLYDGVSNGGIVRLTIEADEGVIYHRFNDLFVPTQQFQLSYEAGTSDISMGFAMDSPGPFVGPPTALHAGDLVTKTYADLGGSGQFLRFEKTGGTEVKVKVRCWRIEPISEFGN